MVPDSRNPAKEPEWALGGWAKAGIFVLFCFAGYLFTRAHFLNTKPYIDLQAYIAGHERLVFQRRVLTMLMLRGLAHIPIPARLLGHVGIFSRPETIYLFLIDMISVAIASFFCVRLHHVASPQSRYRLLVYPVFLFALVWTYLIHTEANLYYPYDMTSLAFFSAGLFYIYTRRFLPLVVVFFFGTLNRETTLFLIPLFALDALAPINDGLRRVVWSRVPWLKTALLCGIWMSIKIFVGYMYRHTEPGGGTLFFRYNLRFLPPNNWPQMAGACGFLLPVLWCLRRRIPDPRIAAYILILPFWFVTMCAFGILMETRIYGELCSLVAVASVLLLEAYVGASGCALDNAKSTGVEQPPGSTVR